MLAALGALLVCAMSCKNPRHQVYCERFVASLDRTQSAIDAGYSAARARTTAYDLMQREDVRAEITRLQEQLAKETRVRAHLILQELAIVGLSSIDHYTIDDNGHVTVRADAPPGAIRAVSKIKRRRRVIRQRDGTEIVETDTELALWDKNPATTNALKHLGLLTDVVEHRDLTLEDLIRDAATHAASDAGDPSR